MKIDWERGILTKQNRKVALIVLILCLGIIKIFMLFPLDEPLTKAEVSRAVKNLYPNDNIKRITLCKGGLAGNIGFFFVELKSGAFLITPNDKRATPWIITDNFRNIQRMTAYTYGTKILLGPKFSLLDYYRHYHRDKRRYPSINNTFMLQLIGLMRFLFNIKSKNHVYWDQYMH
jgi:hypothetical protein